MHPLYCALIYWWLVIDNAKSQSCPNGWSYFNGTNDCYQVFTNLAVNFTQAVDFCTAQNNAVLTSVQSAAEVAFLMNLSYSSGAHVIGASFCEDQLLVGAHLVSQTNRTYYWIDGTPWNSFDSTGFWYPGMPDDAGGVEDTAQITLFPFNVFTPAQDCPGYLQYNNIACRQPSFPPTTTPPPTTTTTMRPVKTCCPTGGVWSQWSLSLKCNSDCGSCGSETHSRSCYSASNGCPCSGVSSAAIACNPKPCVYPSATCCQPFRIQKINGKNICGPLQTLPL